MSQRYPGNQWPNSPLANMILIQDNAWPETPPVKMLDLFPGLIKLPHRKYVHTNDNDRGGVVVNSNAFYLLIDLTITKI